MHTLNTPHLFHWFSGVFFDWACIIGVLVLVQKMSFQPLALIFAILVIGNRQHALSIMAHDGSHYLATRNKRLNDILTALLTFYPLSIGMNGFRKFHFSHHSLVGTPHDPELFSRKLDTPYWNLPATPQRIFWSALKDLSGLNSRTFINLVRTFPKIGTLDFVGPALWWVLVGSVLVLLEFWWVMPLWAISLATSFLACFHLRVWTEHIGTTGVHRIQPLWWERLIFLPHNTWCHYEHHEWPTIPYWRLPESRNYDTSNPIYSLKSVFETYRTAPITQSGEYAKNK